MASGVATAASVNKAGIDESIIASAVEEAMAERIKRRKSMMQTSLGSASFNQGIPELNNVVYAATSKRRDTI